MHEPSAQHPLQRTSGLLLVALLLAMAPIWLVACGKGARGLGTPPGIAAQVALQQVSSCEALTKTVQDAAVLQMRAQLEQEKNGYGVGYAGGPGGGAGTPLAAGGAPANYTTTNTQVAGVDEADFVKNDGTRIFVLSGQTLYAAQSWPPESLALASKTTIEGWPGEMFLEGDQVVVFSSIWTVPQGGGGGPDGGGGRGGPGGGIGAGGGGSLVPCRVDGGGCFFGWGTTKITVLDVADLHSPKVVSELYLPGFSTGARRVGGSVRLVLSDVVRWPEALKWWPQDPALYQDKNKLSAAIDALENSNEAILRATPSQAFFPNGKRKTPDGNLIDVGYRCTDFYASTAPERLGLVTIATLDLAHLEAGVSRSSIIGEAGVLYATAEHLYLASRHWWWFPSAGQRDYTYLHEFDLTDPASARYLASGGVEGTVGDQFAMDEKDGYLRVATTSVTYSEDPTNQGWIHATPSTRLTVLAPRPVLSGGTVTGSELALVGEVFPLEEGERLLATRFTGDSAFAVTFRNFDPLITLDLTDPAHPKKVAELTLPGFSTYLQPIDAGHLLAIGEDLPLDPGGHPYWSKSSLELSLFDVSDLAHPKRTSQALVGTAWAYSEALWDHHAFNWYRPDPAKPGLLAIPFSDFIQPAPDQHWYDGFVSDVRLFSVDQATGIAPVGALSVGDVFVQEGKGDFSYWYRPWVRRSVLSTDQAGNTFVYAVSDAGVRVAALNKLGTPLATALFPR